MLLIGIALAICAVLLWLLKKSNPNEPPILTGSLPLIGHLHHLMGNSKGLWDYIKTVCDAIGKTDGILRMKMGPVTLYAIADPDDCLTVCNACLQKDSRYDFAKAWLGEGLLTSTLHVWKKHRKLLGPAFSQVVLDGFIEIFNKQAFRLVDDLTVEVGQKPFDIWLYTRNNSLQTICLAAMGMEYTDLCSSCNKYGVAIEEIFSIMITRFQKFWLYHPAIYKFSSLKRKQDECIKNLHAISNMILKRRKANFLRNKDEILHEETNSAPKFKPFMDLLLELSIVKGELNDQDIREEIDTMMAAGHETTARVLMFTLLLIGSYPEVQERIHQELREIFGNDTRDITKQDLSKLVYLEAVLKESMRIYPMAPVILRYLDKDVKLRNCTLSGGRSCFLLLYAINHHASWGPDVKEFKPERWLNPASLPKGGTALATFSMGSRMCIGKTYAYMSMKITIAQLLWHYKIKGDHTNLKLKLELVLKPISGHYVSIVSRKNNY